MCGYVSRLYRFVTVKQKKSGLRKNIERAAPPPARRGLPELTRYIFLPALIFVKRSASGKRISDAAKIISCMLPVHLQLLYRDNTTGKPLFNSMDNQSAPALLADGQFLRTSLRSPVFMRPYTHFNGVFNRLCTIRVDCGKRLHTVV